MNNPIYTTDIIKAQLQNLIVCHNYRVYYSLHYSNKNFEAYLDKNTLEFRANNTIQNVFVLLTKDQRVNGVLLEIKAIDLDNNSTLVHSSFVVCDNFDNCEPPYPSPTPTPSITPSVTPTISVTPSVTPTISLTPSITPTNSVTPSVTPTISLTPSITPTNSVTPSVTQTVNTTPTNTATPSVTPTNTATPSATPSSSPTPTISLTPSVTPTNLNCIAGSSWSSISLGDDRSYRSIAYGNGRFVAIISGYNELATSTDGINWSSVNLPSYQLWTDIAYGNGRFMAISLTNNFGITSTDGLNWNTINLPAVVSNSSVSQYTSITFGNGLFVISGINLNNSLFAAYSTNGSSWTISNLPQWGNEHNLIRYVNGKFINVQYYNNNSYNYYNLSDNGITWTTSGSAIGGPSTPIRDVVFGNSTIVAVENSSRIYRSTNATTWTSTTVITANWNSISYGNGKFVVIADGTAQALTSSDGATWTVVSLPTSSFWKDITYGTHINKFVAIGSGGAGAISTC